MDLGCPNPDYHPYKDFLIFNPGFCQEDNTYYQQYHSSRLLNVYYSLIIIYALSLINEVTVGLVKTCNPTSISVGCSLQSPNHPPRSVRGNELLVGHHQKISPSHGQIRRLGFSHHANSVNLRWAPPYKRLDQATTERAPPPTHI